MTNVELKEKVEEILAIENYFDRAIAISNFDKEYKTSDFFKLTKKPLNEVIKEYKLDNLLSGHEITKKIQKIIDNINMDNINSLFDNISTIYGNENQEIKDLLEDLKDIIA